MLRGASFQNSIKFVDFKDFAEKQTFSLCNHIDNFIQENNVSLQYLKSGKEDKKELVNTVLNTSNNKVGLIAVFSAVEVCKTTTIQANYETKKLESVRNTKCKHYYLYFNDKEFGLMFFRIQTWFPYNVQIYVNGRE